MRACRVWIMSVVATIMAFIYSFIGLGMSIGMATGRACASCPLQQSTSSCASASFVHRPLSGTVHTPQPHHSVSADAMAPSWHVLSWAPACCRAPEWHRLCGWAVGRPDPGHQDLGHLPGTPLMHPQSIRHSPVNCHPTCTKLLCSMPGYFTFTC